MANKDNTYSPSSSSSTLNLHRRPRRTQHSTPQTQSNPPPIAHRDLHPHPKIAHHDLPQHPSIARADFSTAHQDLPQQPKNLKLILKLPHKPRSGIAADSSKDSSSSQCTPSTVLAPLPSSPISGSIEKLPKLVILGRDSVARRGDRSNPSGPKLDSAQNGGPKVVPGAPIAPIATIRSVEKGLRSSRLEKQDGLATHSDSAVPEEENGDAMPPRKRKLRSLAGGDRVVGNIPNGGQKEEISSPAKKLTEKKTNIENTEDALKLSIVTPLPPKSVLDGILERLQKKDTYGVFAEPVDGKEVRGYYDIIKNPMDFGTMKTKLSKGAYRSLESFEGDVFLVCSNAMHFNGPKTIYFKQAKAIQAVAQKEFQSLRSVLAMAEGRLGGVGSYYKSGPVVAASREVAVMDGTYGSYAHCLEIAANIVDENKERSSFLAENNGKFGFPRDGRRPLSTEENRRNTYQPFEDDNDYSMNSISLMAVGNQPASSYVHSLSQFGANFGPAVRSHVEKKIQRVLSIQRLQGLQTQGVAEDLRTSVTDQHPVLQTRPPSLPGHVASLPKGGADTAMGPRSNAFSNAFSDAHTAGPSMGVMHFPTRTGNMIGGPLQNMHGVFPAGWTGQPSSRNLSAINLNSVPAPQVAGFIEVNPTSSGMTPSKHTEKSVAAVHDVMLHRMGSNASQLSAEGSDGPQREVSPMPYMFQNATRDVQGASTKPLPHEPQFFDGSRSETRNPVMPLKSLPCSSQTAVDMSRGSRDVDAPPQAFPDSGWKIQSRGPETMFSQDLNIALDVNGTIESPPSARRTPLFVSSSAQAGCTVPFLGNSSMQPGCIKEDGKMVSNEAHGDDFVLRDRVLKLMGLQQQQQFFQKPDDLSSKVQQVNSQGNYAVQQHPLKAHDFIYPAAFVNCNPPSGSQIWHSSSSTIRSDQQAQSSASPRPSASRAQTGSQQPDLALQL